MDRKLGLSKEFPPDPETDNASVVRYRAIVDRRIGERIHAYRMALLAPLLGNRKRATGFKAFVLKAMDFLAVVLFPWRHIQILIK